MKNSIFVLLLLVCSISAAQENNYQSVGLDINEYIKGTLVTPGNNEKAPLVLILQGSGPTDRDGNQSFLKNDALKKLAHALAEEGIASYRYDKRIFQVQRLGIKEQDMRFDDFVTDAITAIDHFKTEPDFSKIIVLGHSQGSLVGMIAAKDRADAFISVAGLAQPIDSVLTTQVAAQLPGLKENVQQAFSELRSHGSTSSYNPVLESIFRPSVQPFILSWMKYHPQEEISSLDIPVLIINGTNDLQVSETEAELLKHAYPKAQLALFENMNHILRKIEGDDLMNNKSYNEPGQPLHPELIPQLVEFVRSIE
ncbi:alpha/beta hydrolase family protein [Salinimicrobium xinjiangense]|uniref:alpha/beta hydrolase family protein n=1 Tax=Salinimicrobium xinjiangense TaxID=438596 RepID=UPI00040CF81F|nr:alpha/beta hydrolase [Salinimicrobium xinjiangense]